MARSRLLPLVVVFMLAGSGIGWLVLVANRQSDQAGDTVKSAPSPQGLEPLPPLVFERGGNIWRSDGDWSAPVQLTSVEPLTYATAPVVSPDGQWIAYSLVGQPQEGAELPIPSSKLQVIRADGAHERVVWDPPQGLIGRVSWTGDGQSLYAGITGLRAAPAAVGGMQLQEIVRVDVDTGAVQPGFEDALDPAMSRDGRWLAYLSVVEGATVDAPVTNALQITTVDGSEGHQVLDGAGFSSLSAPRFSPDGKQLVFSAAGGPEMRRTPAPAVRVLEWLASPASAHGEPSDLWVVNVDGTGLRRLTHLNEDQLVAAFAPDGTELAMIGAGGLYRMNPDGSRLRKVTPEGGHGGLDWMPR